MRKARGSRTRVDIRQLIIANCEKQKQRDSEESGSDDSDEEDGVDAMEVDSKTGPLVIDGSQQKTAKKPVPSPPTAKNHTKQKVVLFIMATSIFM